MSQYPVRGIGSATPSTRGSQATSSTSRRPSVLRRVLAAFTTAKAPQFPLDPSWAEPHPEMEDALFAAVNESRAANGVPPVQRDPLLDQIARWKAMQCAWGLYMAHEDDAPPIARPFGARFQDFGYQGGAGENLAYGFLDAATVQAAFMSDIGHKANVLNASYQGIGLGVARTTANTAPGIAHPADPALIFWCQDFGTAAVTDVPPPPPVPLPGPQVGSKWRSKTNPLARPITVTAFNQPLGYPASVTYQTWRGIVGHLTLTAFYKRYKPA